MDKAKHTPGPWEVRKSEDSPQRCSEIYGDVHGARCTNIATVWNTLKGERESNARLIAAAPELLDLCTELRNCLVDYFDKSVLKNTPQIKRALDNYRSITAKAEGR
jgi:hypothetical protein